jgi:hypothetical protein
MDVSMPKAKVSGTQVLVSGFGYTRPKQWQTLLDRLKARHMLGFTDQAVIYLRPRAVPTEQVEKILAESGFKVSR